MLREPSSGLEPAKRGHGSAATDTEIVLCDTLPFPPATASMDELQEQAMRLEEARLAGDGES